MNEKEQFLSVWEKEVPTTLKLLRAYPAAKADLKPHEKARSAKAGRQGAQGERRRPEQDGQVLHRAEADERRTPARLLLVSPDGPGPPPRPVLGLSPHGGWQGAVDLRAFGGRALEVGRRRPGPRFATKRRSRCAGPRPTPTTDSLARTG